MESIEIKYEPSFIGVTKHLLQIQNKDGGLYETLLIGQSNQPLPKGPFKIGPKGY